MPQKDLENEDFYREIENLINFKTEGDYWDFKSEWHCNNADLLHDIICMANNLVDRDCYIIFGVSNNGEIIGVANGNRKKQQNVIDFLREKQFAGDNRPTVYVQTLSIAEKEIDVLIIKNRIYTPYYLSEKFQDVRESYVYTRIGDTNTPKDKIADLDKIEYLWKKRLGLLFEPLEKVKILLLKSDNWERSPFEDYFKTVYYCKTNPEFTIEIADLHETDNRIKKPNHMFFYICASIGAMCHPIFFRSLHICYHSTLIFSTETVNFDEGKCAIIVLDTCHFNKIRYNYNDDFKLNITDNLSAETLIYAYEICDSFEFAINKFIYDKNISETGKQDAKDIRKVIPCFSDTNEREEFISMVESNLEEFIHRFEKIENCLNASNKSNEYRYDIEMSLRAGEALVNWLYDWRNK